MRRTIIPALFLAGLLGACASASGPPADRTVYRVSDAGAPRLDDVTSRGTPVAARPPLPAGVKRAEEMSEAEKMAWFQSHGVYPYPFYPAPTDQGLGYVVTPTDWGWVGPTILTAGALYGMYRLYRHYDWW